MNFYRTIINSQQVYNVMCGMRHSWVLKRFKSTQKMRNHYGNLKWYVQWCMQSIRDGIMELRKRTRGNYNTPVALRLKLDPADSASLVLCMYTKLPIPQEEVNKYRLFIHNRHKMGRRIRNHEKELTFC